MKNFIIAVMMFFVASIASVATANPYGHYHGHHHHHHQGLYFNFYPPTVRLYIPQVPRVYVQPQFYRCSIYYQCPNTVTKRYANIGQARQVQLFLLQSGFQVQRIDCLVQYSCYNLRVRHFNNAAEANLFYANLKNVSWVNIYVR